MLTGAIVWPLRRCWSGVCVPEWFFSGNLKDASTALIAAHNPDPTAAVRPKKIIVVPGRGIADARVQ
jgi:hypothetical protein